MRAGRTGRVGCGGVLRHGRATAAAPAAAPATAAPARCGAAAVSSWRILNLTLPSPSPAATGAHAEQARPPGQRGGGRVRCGGGPPHAHQAPAHPRLSAAQARPRRPRRPQRPINIMRTGSCGCRALLCNHPTQQSTKPPIRPIAIIRATQTTHAPHPVPPLRTFRTVPPTVPKLELFLVSSLLPTPAPMGPTRPLSLTPCSIVPQPCPVAVARRGLCHHA